MVDGELCLYRVTPCFSGAHYPCYLGVASRLAFLPPRILRLFRETANSFSEQQPSNSPMVVEATDAAGHPVAGAAITWAITQGSGTLSNPSAATDSNGLANSGFLGTSLFGNSFQAATVTVSSASASVSFTITTVIFSERFPVGVGSNDSFHRPVREFESLSSLGEHAARRRSSCCIRRLRQSGWPTHSEHLASRHRSRSHFASACVLQWPERCRAHGQHRHSHVRSPGDRRAWKLPSSGPTLENISKALLSICKSLRGAVAATRCRHSTSPSDPQPRREPSTSSAHPDAVGAHRAM